MQKQLFPDVRLGTTKMYDWGCPTCTSGDYPDVHVGITIYTKRETHLLINR